MILNELIQSDQTENHLKNNDFKFRLVLLTRIMLIATMITTLYSLMHFFGINDIGLIQASTNAIFSCFTLILVIILNRFSSFFTAVLILFLVLNVSNKKKEKMGARTTSLFDVEGV